MILLSPKQRNLCKAAGVFVVTAAVAFFLFQSISRSRAANSGESRTKTVANSTRSANGLAAPVATSYTWTPLLGTDWQIPTNWSPSPRVTPAATDILIFDGSVTPAPIVTNVPTQTISELDLTGGAFVTLNAATIPPGDQTLTISGGGLSIAAGTALTLAGSTNLTISVASGSTGTVGGQIILQDAAHRLLATDANGITFQNGSIFTTTTGFTGNAFGDGSASNGAAGSVVFASGSSYFHSAGQSPFGNSANPAVCTFQTASLATFLTGTGFEASGRTYADLTIGQVDPGGVAVAAAPVSGSGDFEFDNLSLNSPAAGGGSSLSYTGTGGSAIKIHGNITSNGGSGSAQDVILAGGTAGILINRTTAGTITFGHDANNTKGIEFESNASVASGTTLLLGRKLLMGISNPPTLVLSVDIDGALTGDANGYVIGKLLKNFSNSITSQTLQVGDTLAYSPIDATNTTGAGTLTINARSGKHPSISGTNALKRYWQISSVGVTQADLKFQYDAGDVPGSATESSFKIFKYNGSFTQFNPSSLDTVNHFATLNGVTSFSDWTLAEPAAVPTISIPENYFGSEGDTGQHNFGFLVSRSIPSTETITFHYATTDGGGPGAAATGGGSCGSGIDYISTSGTFTINPSDTGPFVINVPVCGDSTVEPDEQFTLTLDILTNATFGQATTLATISNDDTEVTVAVAPASVVENDAPNLTYTFTRSGVTTTSFTANFAVSGTASSTSDYALTDAASFNGSTGTVTFDSGDLTKTVTVDPTADTTDEADETAIVTVTSGAGYNVGSPDSATGTITDDDSPPSILLPNNNSQNEGDAGDTDYLILVSLSEASGKTVSVHYTTAPDTGGANPATAGTSCAPGEDYKTTDGTLTFNPGDTIALLHIPVCGETTVEPDETFKVTIDTPVNVTIPVGGDTCGASITNDDAAPEINVKGNNVSIVAGDTTPDTADDTDFGSTAVAGGTVVHTFTIENTGTAALNISSIALSGTNMGDFALGALTPASPIPAGNSATFDVTFDPSATGLRTATVTIANDDSDESSYDYAIRGTGTAPEIDVKGNSVSIVDGDTTPSATDHTDFGSTAVNGATIVRTFTIENVGTSTLTLGSNPVSITGANAAEFSVTQPSTTSVAAPGSTTFQVTFDPVAVGTRVATININNDDTDENPYDFSIQGTSTGTPGTVQFSAANYTTVEHDSGQSLATITVTRTGGSEGTASVHYDASAGTASDGSDFSSTAGDFNWADGDSTSQTFTVAVNGDTDPETNETVSLTLSDADGATLGTQDTATLTIVNDELVVTKTADTNDGVCDADCSLREAITIANLDPDANTINFAIPSGVGQDPGCDSGTGVCTIKPGAAGSATPATPLPAITQPVFIDGYSQTGAGVNTLPNGNNAVLTIELDGTGAGAAADGLLLDTGSDGSIIMGLVINRFLGNGVKVASGSNDITGNFIGTNAAGTAALGNHVGVYINNTSDNAIGCTTPDERNVISGNTDEGVEIYGATPTFNAKNNLVQGNFIGTDKTGLIDLGNGGAGVKIYDGSKNTIGVDTTSMLASGGNVISGNGSHGVEIASLVMVVASTTTDNAVLGNFIGTDRGGTLNLHNDGSGVAIYDASSNVIGGVTPLGVTAPLGNVIANNGRTGVLVEETVVGGPNPAIKNSIRGNSIHDNVALGIDLTPAPAATPTPTPAPTPGDGVTLNDDPGDSDAGPNNLQNFPGIAPVNAGSTAVTGTLNSSSGGTFTIDIYANDACDSSGHGEGKTLLGSGPADPTSNPEEYTFSVAVPTLSSGQVLTATATDQNGNGNTSEFSHCVAVVATSASISGSKFVSGSTFPNSTISYTIILSNNSGSDQADNPGDEFSDVLSPRLTLVSADASAGVATATIATRTVTWNGSVTAGDSVTITITATINSGTEGQTIANQGQINSDANNSGDNETHTTTNAVGFVVCPTTRVVTTSANSGAGSLRQAILDACPGTTITFDMTPGHVISPITLTTGELVIDKDLKILGPTATALTISGNDSSRVFNVQSGNSLAISNLTIANGKVTGNGGGGIFSLGNLTITNSTFTANLAAGGKGGAIDSEGGNLTIINSTISGNKADLDGGGILNSGSSSGLLNNVTITNNRADADGDANGKGGGLGQVSNSNLTLNNTIVAGNFRGASPGTNPDDVFVDVPLGSSLDPGSSNNLVGVNTGLSDISDGSNGNRVGTVAVPINPRLGALASNGGPTKTHLLLLDSPARNAGSNGLARDELGSPLATDQRGTGFPRIINGTVDIGALESNYTISATAGTPQSTLFNTAFATQLQATVKESGNTQSGVTVTFTAPASGASGTFPGNVTTANATTNASGVATAPVFTANGTAGGPYNVVASLTGGSPAANFLLTNAQATTTTTVISSVNPSNSGQNVTFTATVTSAAGSPTGTVTFKDNGVAITGCSNRPLASGQATCDTSGLVSGNHPITAGYNGDTNFATSTGTLAGGQVVKADVSVTVSPASMEEDVSGGLVYTFTRNGPLANALTINFSVGGTATFTTDYTQTGAVTFTPPSGTVTFFAGSSLAVVTIDPVADITREADETVILTVTSGTGYNAGSPAAATGTILNDDADYQLILDESGPDPRQAAALESLVLVRDPFSVQRFESWLNLGADPNTRVILFVNNLTLASGETVVVNLVDGSNQMVYDLTAEDVRPVPNTAFLQVMFRLPDGLTPGSTCTVRIKAHGQIGNKGTFRIMP